MEDYTAMSDESGSQVPGEGQTVVDAATRNQLWMDPNWLCPKCQWTNLAVRERCRNCGYDTNCGEFPWYDPMPPYNGLPRRPLGNPTTVSGDNPVGRKEASELDK